jgi:hypothetical protein
MTDKLTSRLEMQIHLMTIARGLRLRYVESAPPEPDADVKSVQQA